MRALVLTLGLAGCFAPEIPTGVPCSESGRCPLGQFCGSEGLCLAGELEPPLSGGSANPPGPGAGAGGGTDPGDLLTGCPPVMWVSGGGIANDRALASVVDADCNTFVCGTYEAPIANLGLSHYAGNKDAFLLKFDPAGMLSWSAGFGGTGADVCQTIDVAENGDVVIGGAVFGTNVAIAGRVILGQNNAATGYVARFTNQGTLLWATSIVQNSLIEQFRVVRVAGAEVYAGGQQSVLSSEYGVLTHLGENGTVLGAVEFVNNGSNYGYPAAVNAIELIPDGLLVAGSMNGTIIFRGDCRGTTGATHGFVARFDRTLTNCAWSAAIENDSNGAQATGLAFVAPNHIFVTGDSQSRLLDFPQVGSPMTGPRSYIARIDDLGATFLRGWWRGNDGLSIGPLGIPNGDILALRQKQLPDRIAIEKLDIDGMQVDKLIIDASGGARAGSLRLHGVSPQLTLSGSFTGDISLLEHQDQSLTQADDFFIASFSVDELLANLVD